MIKDLISEITSFIKGKTIDALIPSITFVSVNSFFGLTIGIFVSISFSIIILLIRWLRKEDIRYGSVGLIMLIIASFLTILTNNPNTYFLPDLITNFLIVMGILVTLFINKPFAAYASHITRSWPLEWYWRNDIKPAYFEVSIIWGLFFSFKLLIQIFNLLNSNLNNPFVNILLGFPFTLFVMSLSYLYGIKRLKNLKGPSVEEFRIKANKPYKGQTKGF